MAEQTNLELIGIEERNENELPRNQFIRDDINHTTEYTESSDLAQTHDEDGHPWGKGTGSGGHQHSTPQTYNSLTRNEIRPQLDTAKGGGAYDIYGKNGNGGRIRLININKYNTNNAYGENSVDTTQNIADGQYYYKA